VLTQEAKNMKKKIVLGCLKYVSNFEIRLVKALSYHLMESSKESAYIINIRCEMLLATAS